MKHNSTVVRLTPNFVLKTLISVNIIMYIISLILSLDKMVMTINPLFALAPSTDTLKYLGASGTFNIDGYQAWWSLITANWLHGSLLHIIFNMMALRTVVPLVIKEFGISRMFSIYTLSGMAGFYMSYIGDVQLTIGASSGLCGLIGAALFFGKVRGGDWGNLVFKQTSHWVISLAIFGFFVPNINNWSHGGGFIAGILVALIFGYTERRRESIFDQGLALLFVVVTIYLITMPVYGAFKLVYA